MNSTLPEPVRQLHRGSPVRLVALFLADWSTIGAVAAVWAIWPKTWLLPFLWTLVGSRQHALAVVMHETVHQRLSRRWSASRVLGILCAWPLFISWSSFRRNHLGHHKHLNTDDDPDLKFKIDTAPADWIFPKTSGQLALLLTKDLLGYGVLSNARRLLRYGRKPASAKDLTEGQDSLYGRIIFASAFAAAWIAALGWTSFLLLWLVPLFTTLPFMLRFRSIAEHFHLSDRLIERTRTIRASWFEREVLGFGPHLIGYHAVHHVLPGVPCYNLRKVYEILRVGLGYETHYMSIDGYLFGPRSLIQQLRNTEPAV
jgi:fatty acid desaturase